MRRIRLPGEAHESGLVAQNLCVLVDDAAVPANKTVLAILDNDAAHKHPKVSNWLARHPRRTFYVTPTSASWLNAVEDFFSAVSRWRLRRGTFTGTANQQAEPFRWTKPAYAILSAASRIPAPSD